MRNVRAVALLLVAGGCVFPACSPSSSSPNETKNVSPTGGSLAAAGATLTIPAGAVDQDMDLSLASVSMGDLLSPPPNAGENPVIAITPYGVNFARAVQVTIPASAGSNRVVRADDERDSSWVQVGQVTFSETVATFTTLSSGLFVATSDPSDSASGGAAGTGGSAQNTGGISASGGDTSASATGGDPDSGGAASTGGDAGTGGDPGTGGEQGSGECLPVSNVSTTCNECVTMYCCDQLAACEGIEKCTDYAECRLGGNTHGACSNGNELTAYEGAQEAADSLNFCIIGADIPCAQQCELAVDAD